MKLKFNTKLEFFQELLPYLNTKVYTALDEKEVLDCKYWTLFDFRPFDGFCTPNSLYVTTPFLNVLLNNNIFELNEKIVFIDNKTYFVKIHSISYLNKDDCNQVVLSPI